MGIVLGATLTQIGIILNVVVGGTDLALALICLMPDRMRPDITRLQWHILRISLSLIFFCEAGRHFYLGSRAVYGVQTPSQESPIILSLNALQLLAAPFLFWVIFSMRRRLAFERDEE